MRKGTVLEEDLSLLDPEPAVAAQNVWVVRKHEDFSAWSPRDCHGHDCLEAIRGDADPKRLVASHRGLKALQRCVARLRDLHVTAVDGFGATKLTNPALEG